MRLHLEKDKKAFALVFNQPKEIIGMLHTLSASLDKFPNNFPLSIPFRVDSSTITDVELKALAERAMNPWSEK